MLLVSHFVVLSTFQILADAQRILYAKESRTEELRDTNSNCIMRTTIEMNGILARKANDDHFVSTHIHIMHRYRQGVPKKCGLRVDPLFQKKKGSTKQRAKACYDVSGFLCSFCLDPLHK